MQYNKRLTQQTLGFFFIFRAVMTNWFCELRFTDGAGTSEVTVFAPIPHRRPAPCSKPRYQVLRSAELIMPPPPPLGREDEGSSGGLSLLFVLWGAGGGRPRGGKRLALFFNCHCRSPPYLLTELSAKYRDTLYRDVAYAQKRGHKILLFHARVPCRRVHAIYFTRTI